MLYVNEIKVFTSVSFVNWLYNFILQTYNMTNYIICLDIILKIYVSTVGVILHVNVLWNKRTFKLIFVYVDITKQKQML